ncbi:MAG: GTP-binding protein [Cyanobacteriota bacterium]
MAQQPRDPSGKLWVGMVLSRSTWVWLLAGLGLAALSQYVQFVSGIYGAVAPYSVPLADLAVLGILGGTAAAGLSARNWWQQARQQQTASTQGHKPLRRVKLTPDQVQSDLENADRLIQKLQDDISRRALRAKIQEIDQRLSQQELHLVVFGTSSAGKTSLINALLGQPVGETAPTLGTTQQGSIHTYQLAGFKGSISLTDTPGLLTIGGAGEAEARSLAQKADLLILVVAGDLLASEYAELIELAQLGKPAILALNKTDQMLPEEVETILAHLRQRTADVIPPEQVVAIAADPEPLKVRYCFADGSRQETWEPQSPDTANLIHQMAHLLQQKGSHLRLANALLQTQTLTEAAQKALQEERSQRGRQIVERMQWATAAALAVTPMPALDVVAGVAIQARMIGELHQAFDRRITLKRAQQAAQSLAQILVQLGGMELATQALGSFLKASPLALMGIPLQAVSGAFLTRVAGLSYLEWLQSGDPWQEEEMQQRVKQQLHNHRPLAFLTQLARQARSSS